MAGVNRFELPSIVCVGVSRRLDHFHGFCAGACSRNDLCLLRGPPAGHLKNNFRIVRVNASVRRWQLSRSWSGTSPKRLVGLVS